MSTSRNPSPPSMFLSCSKTFHDFSLPITEGPDALVWLWSLLQAESSHVFPSPSISYNCTHARVHFSFSLQTTCGSLNTQFSRLCFFPAMACGSLQQVFLSSTTSTCWNPQLSSNTFTSIKTSQHPTPGASTFVLCTFHFVSPVCDLGL